MSMNGTLRSLKPCVLIVEDDLDLGGSLKRQLENQDYSVLWVQSLKEFRSADCAPCVAAVIDLNLPDGSGFEVLEKIALPSIIMTALNSPENRLKGAQSGVVDFIPKPFLFQELLIKLERILKNMKLVIKINNCIIDFTSRTVENSDGGITFLNDKEFQVLKFLVQQSPSVVSRDDVLNSLKEDDMASHRSIDNVIVKLRQLINDEKHEFIKSVRGVGYQWVSSENQNHSPA